MKLEKSIDWVFELIQDENKKLQDALVEMKKNILEWLSISDENKSVVKYVNLTLLEIEM